MSTLHLGASPVAWGFCDVPGWGQHMDRDTALTAMSAVGFAGVEIATALFPRGATDVSAASTEYGLEPIGTFLPVVLHQQVLSQGAAVDIVDEVTASGGQHVFVSPDWGDGGAHELSASERQRLLRNLDTLHAAGSALGRPVSLHPHAAMVVLDDADVRGVLDGTEIDLCLDTGHAVIGGCDPARLVADYPGRTTHVHLKDADAALAARVGSGDLGYVDAVRAGLVVPFGEGVVDLEAVITRLEDQNFSGWYVLEHELMLTDETAATELARLTNQHDVDYVRGVVRNCQGQEVG